MKLNRIKTHSHTLNFHWENLLETLVLPFHSERAIDSDDDDDEVALRCNRVRMSEREKKGLQIDEDIHTHTHKKIQLCMKMKILKMGKKKGGGQKN